MIKFDEIDHVRWPLWVIYNRPSDYPDKWVARLFYISPIEATSHVVAVPHSEGELELFRKIDGFTQGKWQIIPRSPEDDQAIAFILM